jgi:PAS domain S-box-containing protein
MILQYSPFFIPLLISAVITGALAHLGWSNRHNQTSLPFVLLMAATTYWTVFYALQLVSADLASNIILNDIEYPGIVTVPVAWLLLVLSYTGRDHYLTRRNVLLLFIVPVVVVCLVITNPDNLFYTAITPEIINGTVVWVFLHGPLFWIHAGYSYLLSLLALVLIVSQLSGSPGIYRRQIILMIIAAGIPILANMLYVFQLNPVPGLDLTTFTFTITGLIVAVGITKVRLFSMMPVAYPIIFTSIDDGIIVVDRKNRISDLNPAAGTIVQGDTQSVIGKPLVDVLPQCASFLDENEKCTDGASREISANRNGENYVYEVRCRDILPGTGMHRGSLMIFRDTTEKHRSRTAIEMANKKLNLLSSITRHDLANRLTALLGYVELASHENDKDTLKNYFTKIEELGQAIREEIDFSRDYQDMGVKEPVWQNVSYLIDIVRGQLDLKGATVTVDFSGLEIYADPLLLKVVYNLVENAVRHGGHERNIRFSFRKHGDDIDIICEDDGDGVPETHKERVFQRGFGTNTGFGLFLSREILSITGISITENGTPGKGARFEIVIPKGSWRFTGTASGQK